MFTPISSAAAVCLSRLFSFCVPELEVLRPRRMGDGGAVASMVLALSLDTMEAGEMANGRVSSPLSLIVK